MLQRPQIFLTPEKKASIKHILDQMKTQRFEEGRDDKNNSDAARDFRRKFTSNLEANNAAATKGTKKTSAGKVYEYPSETSKNARDTALDSQLKAELKKKSTEVRYQHMQHYRRSLPAYECSVDILNVINKNQVRSQVTNTTIFIFLLMAKYADFG